MQNSIKRSLLLSCLACCGALLAENKPLQVQIDELKKQLHAISTVTSEGTVGIETSSAQEQLKGKKWFITSDILFWHLKVDGTSFAYRNSSASTQPPINGSTEAIEFGWNFGYRFGLGHFFYHDKWDAYLNFTSFRSAASKTASGSDVNAVIPLRGGLVHDQSVGVGKSSFNFDDYTLDLELGRNYFISSQLSLRPHLGVETAWIFETQRTRFSGGSQLLMNTLHIKDRSRFWGIGPRTGIGTQWYAIDRFYLYGQISFSLLYAYYDIMHREYISNDPDAEWILFTEKKHQFSPTAQISFGLGWNQYFNANKNFIQFTLGYEGQYFWNQNQFLKIYAFDSYRYDNQAGDVSLHGVTFRVGLSF